MPRKKPSSGKQHKAELQLKRAIKRGDEPPLKAVEVATTKAKGKRKQVKGRSIQFGNAEEKQEDARRLQSSFVKLSADVLADAKEKASKLTLTRPIPSENAVYKEPDVHLPTGQLRIMRRPKWNRNMTKKELEKNEEGHFEKWLNETDKVLQEWISSQNENAGELDPGGAANELPSESLSLKMPLIVPQYERNLEVWRQLWRVTEICEILLVLLDSRCPLLHYPPAFQGYLFSFKRPRKVIFVLTKVDISGPARSKAWRTYLAESYPGNPIVLVESYRKRAVASKAGQGQRKQYEPYLPSDLRKDIVQALKNAHEELLKPPQGILNKEEKLRNWKPFVKENIDWEVLKDTVANPAGISLEHEAPVADAAGVDPSGVDDDDDHEEIPDFLSVGLIGQPNVGKSSLLNALFGVNKVKASKTPGKTKHFQTHFWTNDVRLVDCPGLVFPNFPHLELQVLGGTLPVSQVSAVPSCIHYASSLLPLEDILQLKHPSLTEETILDDKRTWRPGMTRSSKPQQLRWSAMDIMTSYAQAKGWLTAKAGRPDVNRAGNSILRALAEGKIKWAFLPPTSVDAQLDRQETSGISDGEGLGIWIAEEDDREAVDVASDDDQSSVSEEETLISELSESSDSLTQTKSTSTPAAGMFAALSMDDGEESHEDEEEEGQ